MSKNYKIKLSEVEIDLDVYPRETRPKPDHITVKQYMDDLDNGDVFPPLEVQRIKDGDIERTIILDGAHRVTAYAEKKIDEVDVIFWKDDVLDKKEHLLSLILRSAELNSRHGKRLDSGDAKSKFIWLAEKDEELKIVWKDVAKSFGVTADWASVCTKDIISKKRASRDSKIVKMTLEGWTQEEIGEAYGIDRSVVSKIVQESNLFDLCTQLRNQGKTPEELSRELRLDPALTWALLLKDKTDDERFEEFFKNGEKALQAFNVWTIGKRDQRLGNEYPMNIPGQIVMNLLYYFTEQGDLIIDPMAGGGSTIDACLVMNRKVRAYDLVPVREDIIQRDIYDGLDDRAKKAKLIFFDLPYGDMVVGTLNHENFYKLVQVSAEKAYETLGKDGIVAYIMCDYTKGEYEPFIPESYNIFKDVGFKCIHRISIPLSTQSANGDEVNKARKNKKLLGRDRVLFLFRKEPNDRI